MRIGKIRVLPLKKEYLENLEGQNELTKIVDGKIVCEEEVTYSEGEYNINDIAVEALYCELYVGDNLKNKKMISDMFLGEKEFNGQEYGFDEACVSCKCIQPERVKEIISDFDKESIMSTFKELEKELNKMGIFTDGLDEKNDLKLLDDMMNIFQKADKENIGVLYIMEMQ